MKSRSILVMVSSAMIAAAPGSTLAQSSKPNILFILADNLGYEEKPTVDTWVVYPICTAEVK